MSERAEDDVRGEQRRAARQQLKQQQIQRGEGSTAMATVAERRSLPSPEIMLGQPWSSWVDAAKLHGHDGAESEESFKDLGKNREAMRLCREDMPIFGQCPAQDDFYLVMCSHCGHVVKPQAFQAHYGKCRSKADCHDIVSLGLQNLSQGLGNALSRFSHFISVTFSSSPAVKVEKMHLKVESSAKPLQASSAPATSSSSSSTPSSNTTVSTAAITAPTSLSSSSLPSSSSSALKPGLNCPLIQKPPLLVSGPIPNGKGLPADKKQDSSTSSKRHVNKKVSEREFNPDIHCGVMDATGRKPCTRSLTCKTHSLGHRRAVPGRRKRFDILLAEHKNRTRERDRERELHQNHSQQTAPLRDPHPSPQLAPSHDTHLVSHAPRSVCSNALVFCSSGDPSVVHESLHHPQPTPDVLSRPSSDEGENEEREDGTDKLDFLYSGYHPRPAAVSPNSSLASLHKTSTNSHGSTPSSGFLSPPATLPQSPYSQSVESRSSLSYGTTLNAHSSLQGGTEHPAYGTTQARQVSSLPQMPSAHLSSSSSSSAASLASSRALKSRSSSSTNNSSSTSFSSGKKRKNSSLLSSSHCSSESSSSYAGAPSSSSSSSSFKKNCANVGSSGSTYHHGSLGASSSVGLNCGPSMRTNSLSLKAEPSAGGSSGPPARGPPSGSPAESIKRMSVVMNSSDSTLSLGPFVHHQPASSSDHHANFSHHSADGRLEAKKRKSSSASGGTGPGRPKMTKSPALNNIHGKHSRSIPGTPGLPNNSHLHQPKARP
uniref:Ataxin 7 n=1 Tax=Xiphophorus couchianus TaxID=32473 RepID=A0A3B5LPC7_9TELE